MINVVKKVSQFRKIVYRAFSYYDRNDTNDDRFDELSELQTLFYRYLSDDDNNSDSVIISHELLTYIYDGESKFFDEQNGFIKMEKIRI